MNVIEINGCPWRGANPQPLSALLSRLENNTLEPAWFDDGEIFYLAHGSRAVWRDDEDRQVYEDTGPMYPESPYAVVFGGNFADYSHGFRIVTDDPEVIEAPAATQLPPPVAT